jgi:hypothetical protein
LVTVMCREMTEGGPTEYPDSPEETGREEAAGRLEKEPRARLDPAEEPRERLPREKRLLRPYPPRPYPRLSP